MNKRYALHLAAAFTAATLLAMPVVATAQPTSNADAAAQERRDAERARDEAHRRDQQNRRDDENHRDAEHREDAQKRRDEEARRDAEHRQDADRRQDAAQRPRAANRQDAQHRQDQGRGRGAALTADELIGHSVINRNDRRSIGKVTDLVVDDSGQIEAAIVRTGGFLGMFTKDVAIPWSQVQHSTDNDGSTLMINMDKQALRRAPGYKRD